MNQFFYDRVAIYVGGAAYLPDGQIRSFNMDASYNSKQQQGFTPDGTPAGQVIGNSMINFSWEEYLTDAADFLNWRSYLIANPDTQITVIPISLATGVQTAPEFVITGITVSAIAIPAASEGEAIMRRCTFNGAQSSNT